MEEIIVHEKEVAQVPAGVASEDICIAPIDLVIGVEKVFVGMRIWLRIALLALFYYRSLPKAVHGLRKLWQSTKELYGGRANIKLVKNSKQYFYNIYTPGFPSKAYDHFVRNMFSRIYPRKNEPGKLSFVFFAITRKCPLRCEHCFEADNLNGKEAFTLDELKAVVTTFQQDGLAQFHLSGGEPLVRINNLEELIATADKKSEFWILTSGFNFTSKNAERLKQAGATGVVISLDHYEPVLHDAFRGFPDSFRWAMAAVRHAREVGLTTAVTVCVTQSFCTWDNLLRYATEVKKLGVHFIQLLEPKPAGAYKGKSVALSWQQLQLLERFYQTLNFDPAYKDFPPVIYHGYHQRRTGCTAGGYSNVYIDSTGYVNACPFCNTKDYHIRDVIGKAVPKSERSSCLVYEKKG